MGYDLAHHSDFVQTHTKAYRLHDGYQLLFGVDPDAGKCADFKRLTDRPAYRSLHEAMRHSSSVDVVSLCVGVEHRCDLWQAMAQMHPKVVIVEKPLAQNLREARKILLWAKANKVDLCVNYLRRFDPSTMELKSIFKERKYGKVTGVDIRYNGGFYNNASHYIDMMLVLFGKPLQVSRGLICKRGNDYAVDFTITYPGFVVHGRSVDVDCPIGELTFWCEGAQICYRKFGQVIDVLTLQPDPVFRKFNELAPKAQIKSRLAYAMGRMIDQVYRFCSGHGNMGSSGKDALETLEICERIILKH